MRPGRRRFGWACMSAPTWFAVRCVPRLQVNPGAAAGREKNDTYSHADFANLLALSSPVRLPVDLVNFEPVGGRAVEHDTGISCNSLSYNWSWVCGHYRKRTKKHVRQKE